MKSIPTLPYKDTFSPSETNLKRKSSNLLLGKITLVSFFLFGGAASIHSIIHIESINSIYEMNDKEFLNQYTEFNLTAKSYKKYDAIGEKFLTVSPPNLELSKRATLKALTLRPTCLSCETRLVYIDIMNNNGLTEFGLKHLEKSFDISPYGASDIMRWRLQVSDAYWSILPDTLRELSLSQITALAENPKDRRWLKEFKPNSMEIKQRLDIIIDV